MSDRDGDEGLFGSKSGQKKAFGSERGFDGSSGGLARRDERHGEGGFLEKLKPAFGKLGALLNVGADVKSDAQKVLFFLATYGEGDRMGKFVFTSIELMGLPGGTFQTTERAWVGTEQVAVPRNVERNSVAPSEEGKSLGLTGPRFRDAVHFLVSKGWAEVTTDGEFGDACDFNEVKLTAQGRDAAQSFVGRMTKAASGGGGGGFEGLPDMWNDGPAAAAPVTSEREQLTSMLTRARTKFTVDYTGEGANETTTIKVKGAGADGKDMEYNFDREGNLLGVG